MLEVFIQLWRFAVSSRKFWIAPLLAFIVLLGFVLTTAQSSALGPLIYAIF